MKLNNLRVTTDEFTGITTTVHRKPLKWKKFQDESFLVHDKGSCKYICLRHLKGDGLNNILIDFLIYGEGGYFNLAQGKLILKCDQKILHFLFIVSNKKIENIAGKFYTEDAYCDLSKSDLEFICDASILKIRIAGKNKLGEPYEYDCKKFQGHCRQFYDEFYDVSKYCLAEEGCFIATAALGDYNDPKVLQLRSFRDEFLLEKRWGQVFICYYYKWGPYFARLIAKSTLLRKLVYLTIVNPLCLITNKIK